ncbi:LADA_0F05314g1_1 [Lachancea dasiensis]|uniref:LADA_0F05314g1_1 n=1 Tax=Lachancea dasiensis TaxID=1072105 RepID=A0A1G4JJD2_9SACH|nr:LADA_0F05314g1_1 [Lachancea dasiensis]
MTKYTVSYGLIPPQSANINESHILPITKIIQSRENPDLVLTCGRDGTVIRHFQNNGEWQRLRMQTNSDWVSDMVELDSGRFVVVSHDFFVCLLTLNSKGNAWSSRMLGYHDDYVKKVVTLGKTESGDWRFATCGLDMKIKVWTLRDNGASDLVRTINNAQAEQTGSLYALVSVGSAGLPFDMVAGDNNGNLVLCSSETGEKYATISSAHSTNIKLLHSLDNGNRILSSSSDGMLKLWNVAKLHVNEGSDALIHSWKWPSPVWCIQGETSSQLLLGDSRGSITQLTIQGSRWDSPILKVVVASPQAETKGTLAMLDRGLEGLWYSFSGDSNLHVHNTNTGAIRTLEGGFALVKSCLLMNRRQVITQNTRGIIQRWDVISCELLDTFDPSEGDFDHLVETHNTREILPHWCSVSIKTGKVFVQFSPKFLTTEVYGSALEHYRIVNDINIEIDDRYNLGRIAVNSIFNEFISYVSGKDRTFRKDLIARKSSVPSSPYQGPHDPSQVDLTRPSMKDKRKLSLFTKLSMGNNRSSGTPTSMPSTPVASERSALPIEDSFALPPSVASPLESASSEKPFLSKRSASAGSLLTQKFKFLSTDGGALEPSLSNVEHSDAEAEAAHVEKTPPSSSEDKDAKLNSSFITSLDNSEVQDVQKTGNTEPGQANIERKKEHLADYVAELRDEYLKEFDLSSSSFKILGRKPPVSKITREEESPIIEIKAGVLILVNCWKEGSCGDTVSFSTYLPAPQYGDNAKSGNIHIFENLERNLPYWMAKALLKDEKGAKEYPKLTFILKPWQAPDTPQNSESSLNSQQSQTAAGQGQHHQHHHNHHHLPFHRNKHTDRGHDQTIKPLPSVPESHTKLHAASMIKVKKILNYVVDRFDTKTAEMKARTPPSEWLEILCKNQLLDNEMALSSVKTLYWKSQGDIILEYRRKLNRGTVLNET